MANDSVSCIRPVQLRTKPALAQHFPSTLADARLSDRIKTAARSPGQLFPDSEAFATTASAAGMHRGSVMIGSCLPVSSSRPPNPPTFPQPFILAVLSLHHAVQEVPTNYTVPRQQSAPGSWKPKKWLVVLHQLRCSQYPCIIHSISTRLFLAIRPLARAFS